MRTSISDLRNGSITRRCGATLVSLALAGALLAAPVAANAAPGSQFGADHGRGNLIWVTNPSVTGTSMVGWALTANSGAVNVPTATYSYQWQDCGPRGRCTNIYGAGLAYFVPTAADIGQTLRVVVTAIWDGRTASRASARSAPVAPASSGSAG